MTEVQFALFFVRKIAKKAFEFDWSKLTKLNWSRLVPKFRVDRYPYGAAGVEFTWRVGPGIGLGLGVLDLWFGWPRLQAEFSNN